MKFTALISKARQKGFYGTFNTLKDRAVRIPDRIIMPMKLKRMLLDSGLKSVENLNMEEIKQKTLDYIESMRVKVAPYGQYRYSAIQNKPVLYASLYALLTRYLYRDLEDLTKSQRKEWTEYIQSFQDDDGLFKDPAVDNKISNNSDWWGWRHLTLHALMALKSLGAVAKKKFKIIEPFKDIDFTINWLERRDWVIDPATTSNEVQNYFTVLQYARSFQSENWAGKTLDKVFNWLNEKQDFKTGLWGQRFDTPTVLSNGVQTGYHIWLLYFYEKRPIQHIERIIDSCLATQNKFGGFGVPLNSSACEDIDSIDPLVRLSFITDYRKDDIRKSLKEAIPWILANRNGDGGFVFRRMESFLYGSPLMFSEKDASAMFPTWFRTLSLAYLAKYFPDSPVGGFDWQFINCPGLQFWSY